MEWCWIYEWMVEEPILLWYPLIKIHSDLESSCLNKRMDRSYHTLIVCPETCNHTNDDVELFVMNVAHLYLYWRYGKSLPYCIIRTILSLKCKITEKRLLAKLEMFYSNLDVIKGKMNINKNAILHIGRQRRWMIFLSCDKIDREVRSFFFWWDLTIVSNRKSYWAEDLHQALAGSLATKIL